MDWITTDDVSGETWRRVLDYANVDLGLDAITALHGTPATPSDRTNYKKQALQIRVAILQAHEYFQAAERATLFTAANHVYYGISALASALMLVRGSGKKSLDLLRRDAKNTHHGLRFTTGARQSKSAEGTVLLDQSHVEVLRNGHFLNWYSELPARIPSFVPVHRFAGEIRNTNVEPFGAVRIQDARLVIGRKTSLMDLLRYLPDLDASLARYQVPTVSSRATHEIVIDGEGGITHHWTLHSAGDHKSLQSILERFRFPSALHDEIEVLDDVDEAAGMIFTVKIPQKSRIRYRAPSSRRTVDYQQILYAVPVGHEFVDLYLLSFGLSMLARYYPDLWIFCVESHCRAAKLIEAGVRMVMRKGPLLALELIDGSPIVMCSQLPPWYAATPQLPARRD